MITNQTISLKSERILLKKKKLNLALNLLITALGISSLFIKFFLVDGLLAFRAFTVDGNLFTTVVSVLAVIVNCKELISKSENSSRNMFFLQMASAVTEAVIFIVVMIGYLPVFPDDPKITPYHMFCLHVAIPILAVLRFVFFEKPLGILKPSKLLIGAIPIGVYGIGVVIAIKTGILPISLVPYSFLDFDNNFLWYVMFALFAIPSFGFLWAWLFYRLNIRSSFLWYSREDIEQLKKARVKSLSNFDSVNSAILIVYCALAVLLLMFSLMGTSKTSTTIQHDLMTYISYYMLDDYSHMIGDGEWHIKDGALYKGDLFIGDGTEENANNDFLTDEVKYDTTIYIRASDLAPELAAQYDGFDYVSVKHSSGNNGPIDMCGETLEKEIVLTVITDEYHEYYATEKTGKVGYYRYCTSFGAAMGDSGVGIISLYIPEAELTAMAKKAEYNQDLLIIAVVAGIFAALYIITYRWIKALEKSVDFLKDIASGRTPPIPIVLGRTIRLSGLERELNLLREINLDRTVSYDEDSKE